MRLISDQKIEQFRQELKKRKIDAALFLSSEPIHDVNIEYFTGFQQTRFFSFGCLLISQDNSVLVVSSLTYDQALMEAEADEIINLKNYGNSLSKILKEKLKRFRTIGILERIFPCKLSRKSKIKFKDISDIILELRSVKEPKEIKRIQKACHITNQGIKFIERNLSKKMTEKELALALQQKLTKKKWFYTYCIIGGFGGPRREARGLPFRKPSIRRAESLCKTKRSTLPCTVTGVDVPSCGAAGSAVSLGGGNTCAFAR